MSGLSCFSRTASFRLLTLLFGSFSICAADFPTAAFFTEHCLRCHGEKQQKGEFRVDRLPTDFTELANAQRWAEVLFRSLREIRRQLVHAKLALLLLLAVAAEAVLGEEWRRGEIRSANGKRAEKERKQPQKRRARGARGTTHKLNSFAPNSSAQIGKRIWGKGMEG